MNTVFKEKAYYHLPGLFEFYELYRKFLPIFQMHRDYFYDWCEIGSVYGAPNDCIWDGGRIENGNTNVREAFDLLDTYGISARLTFSNSLLKEEHLKDRKCNELCSLLESRTVQNGVIVHSDLLAEYLQKNFPGLYLVSSTTKVLTQYEQLCQELEKEEFRFVVPDFRWNNDFTHLDQLPSFQREKVEFLCNECCWFGCTKRKECYEDVSRKVLGWESNGHYCEAPGKEEGYLFSKAMQNPGFIGVTDILERYLPKGFSHFKIEGRGLGSALVFEFLLYYMVKPENQMRVRELVYLDNTLDLF